MPLYAEYAICAFLQNMRNMLRSHDRYKPVSLKLVAMTERNVENVVLLIWVPGHAGVEGNEWADKVAKQRGGRNQSEADIDMGSAFQHLHQSTVQSWYKEFEKTAQSKPTGTANWHQRCCNGQLSSRIPPGVPRQAQRAISQLRLNRLTSTASYQAFIGQSNNNNNVNLYMMTKSKNVTRCHSLNRTNVFLGAFWTVRSLLLLAAKLANSSRLTAGDCKRSITEITSPICPRCGTGEQTAEHLLLFCPKWAAERQQYFGDSIDITCSRTVTTWWYSSSPWCICLPPI